MSETTEITNPLVSAINAIPGCWALRVNAGRVAVRGGWMHLAPENTPDVIGYVRGRFFSLECKLPGELPTGGQAEFLARADKDGCIAGVVRSVREGLAALGY